MEQDEGLSSISCDLPSPASSSGPDGDGTGGASGEQDSTHHMTKEHAAAFKKVMEKRRIIWCDYAAAFQAALECVSTKQSQDFAAKYIPKALPMFCGEGDPAPTPYGHSPPVAGSAWDDWCGENRRKGNHPAEDQTKYFQTALRCATKLVLHSLDRGSAELIDALDVALDPNSAIYAFFREVNKDANVIAQQLLDECQRLWREGGGPQKRLSLLDKAPWRSLLSVVKSVDNAVDSPESQDILNRVALRFENASAKELSDAGRACIDIIQHFKKENRPVQQSLLTGLFKSDTTRKTFKRRLKTAVRGLALRGTKSSVWAQRRAALEFLEYVIKNDKEYKEGNGAAVCPWLEEEQVIEDLFGERAHATIVSETVSLLSLVELTEGRLNVIIDASLMHVGSVRAEVHKVILALLKDMGKRQTRFILDRIMEEFDVPAALRNNSGESLARPQGDPDVLGSLHRAGSDRLQAAFELVCAVFDTSKLPGLYTTVDVMMKGKKVAPRAMDVLVAALLTPFCEDQEVFAKLVQDSLFHCLQSSWGEGDGSGASGQGKFCKEYVAELCCNIVKDTETQPLAMKGAFAVLMEVIRLFPRSNFAQRGDKTREACIHGLQQQFDVLQACMANLKTLSNQLDKKVMDSDEVLNTELWTRLLQLRYLLENCAEKEFNLTLDERQIDHLWEALEGATEACLRWLRLAADSGGIFDEKVQSYLFKEYICKMETANLRPHAFNCFQAFFGDCNAASGSWVIAGRDGQKSGCKINGAAFVGRRVRVLWKDEKMHNGTICLLLPEKWHSPQTQRHTVRWDDTGKEDTHDWTDLHDWHLLEDELSVNILAYEIKSINKPDSLEGLSYLWDVCLLSSDDTVAQKAADMMLDIMRHMSGKFQDEVLMKLFGAGGAVGALQRALSDKDSDSSTRELKLRRCLQLLQNFLKGQIRICDNTFSYTQFSQNPAHGFRGRGKPLQLTLQMKEDPYKDPYKVVVRTFKGHSRQTLDDAIISVFPQIVGPGETSKLTVVLNRQRLVRGPNTTLEELGVMHGAELKIEFDKLVQQPPVAGGSLGDMIAKDGYYYKVLFELMDECQSMKEVQKLVWDVLMTLPSMHEEDRRVSGFKGQWREVFKSSGSLWRSLYMLQIVDAMLQPSDTDKQVELEAKGWRNAFVSNGGFEAVHELTGEVQTRLSSIDMLITTGLPIVLRVLRLCVSVEVHTQGSNGTKSVGSDLDFLQAADAWAVITKVLQLMVLMTSGKGAAVQGAPVTKLIDASVDGGVVLSVLLRALGSGALGSRDVSQFNRFFTPRSRVELSELGLGSSEIQEGSKQATDVGVLIRKILLQHSEGAVRDCMVEVVMEVASTSPELGSQVVEIMSECINSAHAQNTTCKQFFSVITHLLLTPQSVKDQPGAVSKASVCATVLLLGADEHPLSNEIMFECLTLLHKIMQRTNSMPPNAMQKLAAQLIPKLYSKFLMRVPARKGTDARRLMSRSSLGGSSGLQTSPLCEVPETRQAAWNLLLTALMNHSMTYIQALTSEITDFAQKTRLPVKMWWNRLNSTPKEDWEHKATVERRKLACVGLKNQGATCYMNAMMQQLFLDDTLRKCILTAPLAPPPPEKAEELWKCPICTLENDWNSKTCIACEQGERPEKVDPVAHGELLRQMQRTFRFMIDSELQSFDPIQLVEACRDLGLHFRVTSQNDSSEFFDKLLERLEHEVGGKEHGECLKSCFRVRVSSQLVSVECPHSKPINPGVFEKSFKVNVERMVSLEKAIEDALAGELMTGDSRVDCEQCTLLAQQSGNPDAVKKRAMKRTLFLDGENLPSTLCIQLNRFQFQGNGFVKLNDRLAFPLTLDLAPYTKPPKVDHEGSDQDSMHIDVNSANDDDLRKEECIYELKGIVVHSGQFSFGHYYSFAKDPISGKWLKLDDDQVSEFDLADLESECFGGIQTTVNKWTNCVYKTEKTASAYMLFYHRRDAEIQTPIQTPTKQRSGDSVGSDTTHGTPDALADTIGDLRMESPGAAELAAGVDEILDTNEQMLRRSLFFDDSFSGFTLDFTIAIEESQKEVPTDVIMMALTVFYKSVLHSESHPRLLPSQGVNKQEWSTTLKRLLARNPLACMAFLERALIPEGGPDSLPCWIEGGVVCCPLDDARVCFTNTVCVAIRVLCQEAAKIRGAYDVLGQLVEVLTSIVPTVSQNWRHMSQYGQVLETLAMQQTAVLDVMRSKDALAILLHLYLGPKSPGIKELPKLATMGATSPWPANGRSEADCDALMRTISLLLQGTVPLARLSEPMLNASLRPMAAKLCETDPMGGWGVTCQPLVVELCRRSDAKLLWEIGMILITQLEKQFAEPALRVRQSQCAQLLSSFLAGIDQGCQDGSWYAGEKDLRDIRDQIVRHLLDMLKNVAMPYDRYGHQSRNINSAKRLGQALVMAGQQASVARLLAAHRQEWEWLAQFMVDNFKARSLSGPQPTIPVDNYEVPQLLMIVDEALCCSRQTYLPSELYVAAVGADVAPLKGVFRQEGPVVQLPEHMEGSAGLQFSRVVDSTTSFTISKNVAQVGAGDPSPGTKGANAGLVEVWEISQISGTQQSLLFRTAPKPASGDRFPPVTATWRRPSQMGGLADYLIEVIAQWDPDLTYARSRGPEFGERLPSHGLDCGLEQNVKMQVGTPTGSSRQVRFGDGDDPNSDSASDEAIAGSDQEGGDDQNVLVGADGMRGS